MIIDKVLFVNSKILEKVKSNEIRLSKSKDIIKIGSQAYHYNWFLIQLFFFLIEW